MKRIGFDLHLFLIRFPNPPPLTNLIVTLASSTRNWIVWKGISRNASKSFWILPRSRLKGIYFSMNQSISDNFITVLSLAYLIRVLEGSRWIYLLNQIQTKNKLLSCRIPDQTKRKGWRVSKGGREYCWKHKFNSLSWIMLTRGCQRDAYCSRKNLILERWA